LTQAIYGKTPLEKAEDDELRRGVYEQLTRGQHEAQGWAEVHADRAKYQLTRDDQHERAKRVSDAGVETMLRAAQEFTDTLNELKCLTEAERAEAITAIGEIIRDLMAYQATYRPRPVEIRTTGGGESTGHPGSRTSW